MKSVPKKHECPTCGAMHWNADTLAAMRAHHTTCAHCSKPVFYEYMLKADIWALTKLDYHGGVLHLPCVEVRIGRKLTLDDFDDSSRTRGGSINDGLRWALTR